MHFQRTVQRSAKVDETVTSFIITHGKPHRSASDDTISRWTREILTLAGVDTDFFTPHTAVDQLLPAKQKLLALINLTKSKKQDGQGTLHLKRAMLRQGLKIKNSITSSILTP